MLQVIRSAKIYDVCIIGSGAAGGAAAKVLTEGGVSVVMLEAGPPLDPAKDFKEHLWPYDLPHRGGGVGGKLRGEEADEFMAPNGAWEIDGEPYGAAGGRGQSKRDPSDGGAVRPLDRQFFFDLEHEHSARSPHGYAAEHRNSACRGWD